MSWFYNSFRPLVYTAAGRAASARFELPPFIDGSCRREPDLQSSFPSITGLCRKDKFAPRLHIGDTVLYVTIKGAWGGAIARHRRLVAVLRVRERFDSHAEAALWYGQLGLPLPSNCWIAANPPIPYEQTVQDSPWETWDRDYRARARRYPVFLVTEPLYSELMEPPVVTDEMLIEAFGRVPGTQNPPRVLEEQAVQLLQLTGIRV